MIIICGWASIGSNGKASGDKAGDQNGREVRTGVLYNFGQTKVIRYKNASKGKKAGQICKDICNNSHVGYDQGERFDLFTELKKVKWSVSKLKVNCETDCSQLCVTCANAVGIKVPNCATGNMADVFTSTKKLGLKQFTKLPYHPGMKLQPGDMLIAPGHHVIMVISA